MSDQVTAALHMLRNGHVETNPRLLEPTDPRCKGMQENARGKDEGLRMKDEEGGEYITRGLNLESQLNPLSARQLTAINLLTLGKSVVAIAASLKIDPSTIHRWKSGNPLFIAELNRRQHDAYDSIIVKLRLTMLQAVQKLQTEMNRGWGSEGDKVMWKMLSFLKPGKLIPPTSPTEARDVVDEKIRDLRLRRGEIAETPIEEEERLAWVRAQEAYEGDAFHDSGEFHSVRRPAAETRRQDQSRTRREEVEADEEEDMEKTEESLPSPPLPSRQGPGEGAGAARAEDEPGDEGTERDETPASEGDEAKPQAGRKDSGISSASRPLPQPLPRGEGSWSLAQSEVVDAGERSEDPHE